MWRFRAGERPGRRNWPRPRSAGAPSRGRTKVLGPCTNRAEGRAAPRWPTVAAPSHGRRLASATTIIRLRAPRHRRPLAISVVAVSACSSCPALAAAFRVRNGTLSNGSVSPAMRTPTTTTSRFTVTFRTRGGRRPPTGVRRCPDAAARRLAHDVSAAGGGIYTRSTTIDRGLAHVPLPGHEQLGT